MSGTALEVLRESLELHLAPPATRPAFRVEDADARFTWILDGDAPVALLKKDEDVFELRCGGPGQPCPPKELPPHYHTVTYTGVRIIFMWRLRGANCGECLSSDYAAASEGEAVVITCQQRWSNGTLSTAELRLSVDEEWNAYIAEVRTELKARRATTALEYCNIIPAGIGDSRPEYERFPLTFWQTPQGVKKMLKNPLWWTSVGAQDLQGEKHIAQGGFLGFGPDPVLNPVIEVLASDPETGAVTCCGLQDEHIMVWPAAGRHARKTGWFELSAHYRLFSIPEALAQHLVDNAAWLETGPMVAWKFQYPATPELPADLSRVELPGSPFYGKADWSTPLPWDKPFNGQLWTASPNPDAAIHYDRTVGRERPGSIRLRPDGERIVFGPGSGHTLHLDEGTRYRYSVWVRTRGATQARIAAWKTRFRNGDQGECASATLPGDSDWTELVAEITGGGDDIPFANLTLQAEGKGEAWFTDLAFERVENA